VVLCGSYRKDPEGLRRIFLRLKGLGFQVLSPSGVEAESEAEGFVFMRGQGHQPPRQIEAAHLASILKADFVWLFAPGGYLGLTGAFEIGFAHAHGIPVYSDTVLQDALVGADGNGLGE
jgi:nucleoside 2-deoxyribosyltransferase